MTYRVRTWKDHCRKAAKPMNAADASLNAADAPTRDRVSGFSDVSVEFSTFSGFAAFLMRE